MMLRLPDWVVERAEQMVRDGKFADHYQAMLDHDRTCTSLNNAWLPTPGGVGGCDIEACDACDLLFTDAEGLLFVELPCGVRVYLCECCTR
jgi:hypothetical protein